MYVKPQHSLIGVCRHMRIYFNGNFIKTIPLARRKETNSLKPPKHLQKNYYTKFAKQNR